jgi:hypothetical protein
MLEVTCQEICMLLLALLSTAFGTEILVYGPTNGTNGQISSILADETGSDGLPYNITVWNEITWRTKTTADFSAFDTIVVGDPNCGGPSYESYQAIYDTREIWALAVRGNIFVGGTDPGCHFGVDTNDNGTPSGKQATQFYRQAVAWTASSDDVTGMYASSDWKRATQPVAPEPCSPLPCTSTNNSVGLTYMTGIADLRALSSSRDDILINDAGAVHPVFDGITDFGLSGWRTSYHSYFPIHANFPNDFIGLTTDVRFGSQGNMIPGPLTLHIVRRECDFDQDGFDANGDSCNGTDCDDDDENINTSVLEVCDGIDNNCLNGIDEAGAEGSMTFYQDLDRDGFGNPNAPAVACSAPPLFVEDNQDCRDDQPGANPNGFEIPYDGIDNDCDGGDACDEDNDGFDEDGEFCAGSDCDDGDQNINIDATEIFYNGIDQDCLAPGDYDMDGDGFDSATELTSGTDCDDTNATVFPGADELDDSLDNDCNGYAEDTDADMDGALDEDEIAAGTDPLSSDSDSDGIPDGIELGTAGGAPLNTDGDALIDALDPDDDNDGIPTSIEIGDWSEGDPESDLPNADGDANPNHRDLDSDADGVRDSVEGAVDSDQDGLGDFIDPDSDNDTVPDSEERIGDTDGDSVEDRLDNDDDGDTIPTEVENGQTDPDVDGDTVANWLDDDSDSDGVRDDVELDGDQDCDDLPNFVDADDLDGPCAQPTSVLKGGGCSSVPSLPGPLWLLAFGGLLLRRRRE